MGRCRTLAKSELSDGQSHFDLPYGHHPARHPLNEVGAPYLELEAKPDRGINRAAISQSIIDLREHRPAAGRSTPFHSLSIGGLRLSLMLSLGSSLHSAAKAIKTILALVIISADHIRLVGDGVLCWSSYFAILPPVMASQHYFVNVTNAGRSPHAID